jgi:uncharacterized protein YjbI with pentapeptide repeats
MPEASPCRKKKKLTLIASKQGVETAERALIRLGFDSKSNFAESQRLSRSTVTNFFNQIPIQLDSFKRICDALKLKWQQVAGITEDSINSEQIERSVNPSPDIEKGVKLKMLVRQVSVIDQQSRTIKSVIILKGEIDSISNLRILATILRENGGDTIQIIDIQEGSIKLIIEGSQEDIERLLIQINSGELTEIDGFPVEDAQILSESSEDVEDAQILSESLDFDKLLEKVNRLLIQIKSEELTEIDGFPVEDAQILRKSSEDGESSKQKWRLVEEIVTNPISRRNLSGADLSDADLRNACLIGANLSEADLSDSDLRDANLSDTNLSRTNLSGANLSGAKMRFADLSDADLSGADLSGADLSGADLSCTNLSGTDLSGANLSPAYLSPVYLSRTNLKSPYLKGAKLSFADLRGPYLRGPYLKGTYLKGADLKGADLKGADLRFADLSGTDLRGADLSGADLRGADLRGADLRGIQLKKTLFSDNLGITEKLKQHLIKRGAIFDDSPGDPLSPPIKWIRVRQKNGIFGKDSPSHN